VFEASQMRVWMRLKESINLKSNLSSIALLSFLRGARDNMRLVVWQPFILSLGLSMKILGAFESMTVSTMILAQPIIGSVSDYHGRKGLLLIREVLMLFALILCVYTESWHLLLIAVLFIGLSMAFEPVYNSLVAETTDKSRLGMTFSILNAAYMATGLFAPILAGLLADLYGYSSVFYTAVSLGVLSLLIVKVKLVETKLPDDKVRLSLSLKSFVKTFNPPSHLRGFYVSMIVDSVFFGLGFKLLYGMLSDGYGYTFSMLGYLATALTGAWAVSQIPLGRFLDRVGYKNYIITSQLLSCAILACLLFTQRFEFVLIMHLVMGVATGMWVPAEQAWITSNVDPKERARAIGSYYAVKGLLSIPSPFIGGMLYDSFNYGVPILLNLIGAIIDVVLIATLVKE
jgi:DHA1 family multidrug resistance protein-like MFS transporter